MNYKQVIVEEYDPVKSFRKMNPFVLAFCRTRDHGNVLLKGGMVAVEKYTRTICPCLAVMQLYYHGHSRPIVKVVLPATLTGYFHPHFDRNERGCITIRNGYNLIVYGASIQLLHQHYNKIPSSFPRALKDMLKEHGL